MKVLQVCNKPPYPPRDGGSLAMFNLANSLVRLGHAVTVLTMFTDKHFLTHETKQKFAALMNFHAVYVDTTTHWPILLGNFIFSRKPYNAQRFLNKTFKHELIRIVKSGSYDVIQLEGPYLAPYIPAIRKYSGALISLRAHNVEHEIWKRIAETQKNIFKKHYFTVLAKRIKRFECQIINKYDLLVPITMRDLDRLNRMGNMRPSLVCPAGIDVYTDLLPVENTVTTLKTAPATIHSLFFLGSLDWIPNQEGLLWFLSDVFPLLRINYPALKLHIAGRNAPDSLIKKIKGAGVVFHGEITDSHEFMMANGLLVAPCFSGSGMRVKIVEAMSLGKPVITTPIGAEGLDAKHGENIVIAGNAAEFIHHLERLLKYPDFYQKIGQNAHNFVMNRFNNMTIATNLADFYKAHLK